MGESEKKMDRPDIEDTPVPENIRLLADSIIPGFKFYVKEGWKVNPNEKVLKGVITGIKRNKGECPCYNDGEDKRCPCSDYRVKDNCHCTLYVRDTDK